MKNKKKHWKKLSQNAMRMRTLIVSVERIPSASQESREKKFEWKTQMVAQFTFFFIVRRYKLPKITNQLWIRYNVDVIIFSPIQFYNLKLFNGIFMNLNFDKLSLFSALIFLFFSCVCFSLVHRSTVNRFPMLFRWWRISWKFNSERRFKHWICDW